MRRFLGILVFVVFAGISVNSWTSSGGIPIIKEEEPKKSQPQPKSQSQAKPKPKTKAVAPTISKKELAALRKRSALIAKKKEVLNNTEWDIEMFPLSGKGKSLKDVIVFAENKVSAKSLEDRGFLPTNYTLSIAEEGKLIWETMQSREDEIVFFRGEISPDLENMSGVISFQRLEGPQDYSFRSTAKRRLSLR